MKSLLRALILLAVGISIGFGVRASFTSPAAATNREFITNTPAERILERPIDEIRFEKVPLRLAVQQLGEKAGIPIETDWTWLAKEKVKIESPITLNRRGEKLVDLLREILNQGESDFGLWIEPHGDHIRLLSESEPNPPKLVRMYDLRDFISPAPPQFTPPYNQWSASDELASLVRFLEHNVYIGRYTGLGSQGLQAGDVAGGRVLITQRWEVHRQVEALLAGLRSGVTPTTPVAQRTPVYRWNESAGKWLTAEPEALEAVLEKPLPELRLNNVTFGEAFAAFGKATGLAVEIDYKRLEKDEADLTLRQTIVCPPGPAADAIEQILARPWVAWNFRPMYLPHDGGIRVTTNYELEPTAYFRCYDLRDWPPYVNEVKRKTRVQGESINSSPGTEAIVKAVVEAVASETWSEAGGRWPSIQVSGYQGILLVRQTVQGHLQVKRFLAAIRSLDGHPATQPIR